MQVQIKSLRDMDALLDMLAFPMAH